MKKILDVLIIIILICLIGIVIYIKYPIEKNVENPAREMTTACEKGCVWAYGFEFNESMYGKPVETNRKIFACVIRCNDVFYNGDGKN